jgi:hypothetical protein
MMGGSQKKKEEEEQKKRKTTFRARNTESFTERQKRSFKIVNGRQVAQNLFVLFCFSSQPGKFLGVALG